MKITCDKQILVEAVMNVQKAVSTKSCLAALEGILIKTKGEKLKLCGYDLELGITTEIPCTIEEEGETILNARILADIIRKAPAATVSISTDWQLISTIKSGPAVFSIAGLSPGDYPELPRVEDSKTVNIQGNILKSMIRQTIFAASENDTKPINSGILFDFSEGVLKLVSVDGFRLALRKENMTCPQEIKFVVPKKTLDEVSKLIPDDDTDINISIGKKHIIFAIGSYRIISRLLEGDFLDYKAAIPSSYSTEILINVKDMIQCIERVSLVATDRLKSPVRCIFENDSARISCITTIGKANDELEVKMSGDNLEIGFNNKYLLDALKNTDSDEVKIQVSGPLSPMKVVPTKGDNFTFLVLPVRLKASDV